MLDIVVARPSKTERAYKFTIAVTAADGEASAIEIGIHSASVPLRHAAVWDSFFPLMFLTRNGGPLFGNPDAAARIRFDYEASRPVVAFFIERAAKMGVEIEVTSTLGEIGIDAQTSGETLLFGGGKDSRLLLGMLRETGSDPLIVSAKGSKYASDIANAFTFDTYNFSMPNRIVPALMGLPKTIYHGAGLGEVHETTPWHQYMDISTPEALDQTSALLASIGMDTRFEVPLVTLPYNVIQNILARRYPEIYRHQNSVPKGAKSNKALHVALCKRYHGLDHGDRTDESTFTLLVERFISAMTENETDMWGYRGNYEIIAREMRAILYRLGKRGDAIPEVPATWDENWIDNIHDYANRAAEDRFTSIFGEYASSIDLKTANLPPALARVAARQR